MKSITVALPAYNEAENIPAMVEEVVNTLESLGRSYEVIVVNDGSRDNTVAVVRELETRYPHVRLVDHGLIKAMARQFGLA